MILPIVEYGHPALRSKGREIRVIDDKIRKLATDMLDTMVDAQGVGLAAQQVGLSLQICVVDVEGIDDRPSELRIGGTTVAVEDFMPMVLINPVIEPTGKVISENEGCLSFPGLGGMIERQEDVRVTAMMLNGETLEFEASGLLARAIQHEHDHLHGVLFIDRMEPASKQKLTGALDKLLKKNAM